MTRSLKETLLWLERYNSSDSTSNESQSHLKVRAGRRKKAGSGVGNGMSVAKKPCRAK